MIENKFSGFIGKSYKKRKIVNGLMLLLLIGASCLAVIPLLSIFGYVISQGFASLNGSFFTQLPKPTGETGGGMGNAIMGSFTLVMLASVIGIPWGVAGGLWLSEYGQQSRLAQTVRFCADIMASVPSIVIGLFIYATIVISMKRFSALSGGLALGLLMIPTISRTTEEIFKMVPIQVREAGLALGLPRWKVILGIVLKGWRQPITTAVMIAIARVAGETAPLLFTAFNNRFWQGGLDQPISSLPVQIYTYAISPYNEWQRQAWAGALVLILFVFAINLLTRIAIGSRR